MQPDRLFRIRETGASWAARLQAIQPRTAVLASVAVFLVPLVFVLVVPHPLEQPLGVDFRLYHDVTARWLGGGPFYEAYQVAGPYEIRAGDVLYPPLGLWLFVPFALAGGVVAALAAIGWWLVPLVTTAIAAGALRPRPWTWPVIALCVANPTTLLKIWTGNPVMWAMAAMAVATVSGASRFAAPFVLLKPSLAPFALFGIRRRSWWVGAVALVALSLPFGSLWADWVASVLNSRGGGLLYSALEIPMLLLPLAAWVGRTRGG